MPDQSMQTVPEAVNLDCNRPDTFGRIGCGNPAMLCTELQSFGVRMPENVIGRAGGAGPAEGSTLIIGGRAITVPVTSSFVRRSPYCIRYTKDRYRLYRSDRHVSEVTFPALPRYYRERTPGGTALSSVALVHGQDCLASTVYQNCMLMDTQQQCRFCGIGLSLAKNMTILLKRPEDLGLAAERAVRLDSVRHLTLTSGRHPDEMFFMKHLAGCIRAVKEKSGLPVHVQVWPPSDRTHYALLRKAGADTIGIHLESCDERVLAAYAPAKAGLGISVFMEHIRYAVELFGRNQVSSFLIAGLGEDIDRMKSGIAELCRLGAFPYLLPLRPVPGTALEHMHPPDPAKMAELYCFTAASLRSYGLASAKSLAGCVRCGACSSISLYETMTR